MHLDPGAGRSGRRIGGGWERKTEHQTEGQASQQKPRHAKPRFLEDILSPLVIHLHPLNLLRNKKTYPRRPDRTYLCRALFIEGVVDRDA
jgi:hypothetical protein